jgi:aquaporin Z
VCPKDIQPKASSDGVYFVDNIDSVEANFVEAIALRRKAAKMISQEHTDYKAERATIPDTRHPTPCLDAVREHWPEYLMEAALLGLFMVSACLFGIVLFHPNSAVTQALPDPGFRRFLIGLAMGGTAIVLIYSPWGQQSGAHLNPAVTLTFYRLGKVAKWDAVFYILAQFVGGIAGVLLVAGLAPRLIGDPAVNYVVTTPGVGGAGIAFLAEVGITFVQMSVVLRVSNTQHLARFTPLFAGALVATYITLEAPLSGMSMNPARTFGSAFSAHVWTALWVYFMAPPLGMLLASEVYLRTHGAGAVFCAKLHHQNDRRCIFCESRMTSDQ